MLCVMPHSPLLCTPRCPIPAACCVSGAGSSAPAAGGGAVEVGVASGCGHSHHFHKELISNHIKPHSSPSAVPLFMQAFHKERECGVFASKEVSERWLP